MTFKLCLVKINKNDLILTFIIQRLIPMMSRMSDEAYWSNQSGTSTAVSSNDSESNNSYTSSDDETRSATSSPSDCSSQVTDKDEEKFLCEKVKQL